MARQFLIPWIILIKSALINCQPPQPPGFDRVDHFQHLFTHPTIAPQNSFGIDGFGALHNNHMLHPHYDLLAQNTHVMNPNFIHPHPFFQFHPPQPFTTNNLVPTTQAKPIHPKVTTPHPPTTTRSTTALPTITTTVQQTVESSTTSSPSTTRIPQAVKAIVESVKTYSLEKESDRSQQMPLLSTLEKMDKSSPNSDGSKARKAQNFPTPSSTILPTAQQIDTNVTSTSIEPSTPLSTTTSQTTTVQPTTNLPKKISEETEKASLNGEKLDLIRHLNSSDLESFLHSANLSTHEAQTFLRLVEKVLEEELQKRLHKQAIEAPVETNQQKTEESNPTISAAISPIRHATEPKLLSGEGHEVKTVDTKLNYESAEIDQNTSSGIFSTNQSSRIAAYSQRSSPLEINSADKSHSNPVFSSLDEVRKREQEEFDRLLGQIVLNGDSKESSVQEEEPVDQNEDDDLLPPTLSTQQPARNTFNRQPVRHPPKTNFDQLVKDYQYRLSGNNGLNDLIKALRNAHIGFFDRTKKNRPKIRIS